MQISFRMASTTTCFLNKGTRVGFARVAVIRLRSVGRPDGQWRFAAVAFRLAVALGAGARQARTGKQRRVVWRA
jgi:hypothetical protein